ncbi:hypothetical protein C8J57DRAFT_1600171 [Mycena rebaudengoi]|nr:hypothetical protein C8J57DRAFT_1600171 [Mycena rebaudengoi]
MNAYATKVVVPRLPVTRPSTGDGSAKRGCVLIAQCKMIGSGIAVVKPASRQTWRSPSKWVGVWTLPVIWSSYKSQTKDVPVATAVTRRRTGPVRQGGSNSLSTAGWTRTVPTTARFCDALLGGVVLPAELERAVFEAAAVLDYKNISRLMLVGHRVHTWLKPFLYHVLVYRGPNHHRTDAHELFGTHVRHLMLDFRSLVTDIAKILAVCSAVQSLACYGVLDSSYLPHLALMRPLRLRIQAVNLFAGPPRFSHALFARTTHLQLLDYSLSAFDDDSWASLRALSCLTHLALHAYVAVPAHALHELLRENTRMQALVVIRPSDVGTAGWGAQYPTLDVRFVVAVVTGVASPNLLPGRSRRQRGIASSAPAAPRIGPARASALRAVNPRNYFLRTRLSRRPPALSSSTQPRVPGARTNALCSPYRLLPRFARGRSPIQRRRRLPLVFALRRWCEPRRSRVYSVVKVRFRISVQEMPEPEPQVRFKVQASLNAFEPRTRNHDETPNFTGF